MGDSGAANCAVDALSIPVAMGPGQADPYPMLRFSVSPGPSQGSIGFQALRFEPSNRIEMSIDGCPTPTGNLPGGLDLDGKTTLMRGIRAGNEQTLTSVSPFSRQRGTYAHSLKAYTCAQYCMTRL